MAIVPEMVISARCRYRERFSLPRPGRIVLNAGDTVTPADVVGYTVERGDISVVDIASSLHETPRRMVEYLAVKEGQSVRAGEVLARKPGWPRPREVRVPINSRAMALGAGMALLEGFSNEAPVRGCLPGRVTDVYPGSALDVEGTGALVLGAMLLGREFSGPLKMAGPVPERVLRPEHLDATVHGSVIVAGIGEDRGALVRAAELGAQGVIVGGAPGSWTEDPLPLPVAVVQGLGRLPMSRLAFDLMNQIAGSMVYALVRGGRCWLVAPMEPDADGPVVGPGVGSLSERSWVHVASGPHLGSVGQVTEILAGTGEAIVQLGGKRVGVLVANCEALVR